MPEANKLACSAQQRNSNMFQRTLWFSVYMSANSRKSCSHLTHKCPDVYSWKNKWSHFVFLSRGNVTKSSSFSYKNNFWMIRKKCLKTTWNAAGKKKTCWACSNCNWISETLYFSLKILTARQWYKVGVWTSFKSHNKSLWQVVRGLNEHDPVIHLK